MFSLGPVDPSMLWGVGLIIALPILIIGLGEMADDAALNNDWKAFAKPLLIARNGVVPLAFAAILLRQVAGLPGSHIAVKIVDTALWIIVLNAALAFMNVLLFDEDSKSSSRMRIPRLLLDIMRFVFVVCGAAVTISTIWGVNLGSLITALGVGSVVIGLALQDTLGSLFAGIAMVSARQFRAGDWVRFGNDEGVILSQNWRTVTIKTRAGDALIIPNGVIARAPITVIAGGAGDTTVGVDLRFPYQYPPDAICKMLVEAAQMTKDFVLEPAPAARVGGLDDNAIRYGIAVRAKDPQKLFAVRGEYLSNVWYLAQRRGFMMTGQVNANFALPATLEAESTSASVLAAKVKGLKGYTYSDKGLATLLKNGRIERYRDGQALTARGSASTSVFILLSGRVRAVHGTENAADVLLHAFEPGQFILSKATLRGAGSPYAVKAQGECEVAAVPVADFKAFCSDDIEVAQEFEQILSAREEVAQRAMTKSPVDGQATAGDRTQLVRELFK